MTQLYFICIAAGILIPLCSVLLNLFDGFMDFVTLDLFQLELGSMELDLLPLSVNSLCLFSLIFGLTGSLLDGPLPTPGALAIGLGCGYLSAVILQTAIHKLRKCETHAVKEEEILLHDGEVINAIPAKGYGAVRVNVPGESSPVYPAISTEDRGIPQNTRVDIISIQNGVVAVRPSDWLEKRYDKLQNPLQTESSNTATERSHL